MTAEQTEPRSKSRFFSNHTTASFEVADEICARLVAGETIESICADKDMPSKPTLWRWRRADPDLDKRILIAAGRVRGPKTAPPTLTERRMQDTRQPTPETHPEQWTPLGIMLSRMNKLWADGEAPIEDQREAVSIAKDAAPYVHPRLSAVDAKIIHRDLRDMGEDELLRELALLREQAGFLLSPETAALRLPAVIDQAPVPVPEPISSVIPSESDDLADNGLDLT